MATVTRRFISGSRGFLPHEMPPAAGVTRSGTTETYERMRRGGDPWVYRGADGGTFAVETATRRVVLWQAANGVEASARHCAGQVWYGRVRLLVLECKRDRIPGGTYFYWIDDRTYLNERGHCEKCKTPITSEDASRISGLSLEVIQEIERETRELTQIPF